MFGTGLSTDSSAECPPISDEEPAGGLSACDAWRAVGVKADSPPGPRAARCLDADEHQANISARRLADQRAFRRSDILFSGSVGAAQSSPPSRRRFAGLIGASRFRFAAVIGASAVTVDWVIRDAARPTGRPKAA